MSSRKEKLSKDEVLNADKFLHPKSRKCVAMVKKIRKDTKKDRAKQDCKFKQSLLSEKLLWFQKHINPDICPYSCELTASLVEKYIQRNDEELEQINIKRSIVGNRNRQHTGREDAIRMTKERETCDYETCGLEIPNILNITQYNMLKNWSGDLKFLLNFKLIRFSKKRVDEKLKKLSLLKENKPVSKIENEKGENKETTKVQTESNVKDSLTDQVKSLDNVNGSVTKVDETMDTE